MKEKNIMPEKDRQQTHEKIRWRELRKRILVMGLTVAMVANTVDLSALSVSAKTDESESGKTTIVSFEELSKDITEQTLPIGALESDIKFPTSLTVTVEKTTQADEKEADDEEDASETGDTEKDDAQKDDGNGDTASSDDKKDTASSDEKDGDSGNADASDKSGDSDNGNADTKDSDTSKDSGNSDKSGNTGASDKSDNASASDKSDSSNNSDKSNSSNGSNSTGSSSSSSDSKSQNTGSDKSDKSVSSGSSDKSSSSDSSSKSDDSGSSSDTEDTQARADLPSAFGALIGQMPDTLLPHKLIVHAAEKDDASDAAKTTDAPSVSNDAKKTDTASASDNADNAKKSDTVSASNTTANTKTTSAASDTTSSAKSVKTTGSSDAAASSETETTTEKIRLKNIKWELNVEESDAEEFDSSEASNGFCYAYTPVLPEEDGDGNQLVLGKDVELPTIYVLVGEYGIALLADGTIEVTETTKDGEVTTKPISGMFDYLDSTIQNKGLKKVEIKLFDDYSTDRFAWLIEINNDDTEEMILDLNGHKLTLKPTNKTGNDADGGLVFKNDNTTIKSSADGGQIVGYRDKVGGCGLITVGSGSELKIKNVQITNEGTAPTVIVGSSASSSKETATCTMTDSIIIGRRKAGIVGVQNGGDAVCTIGKGTIVRNQYCSLYGKTGANCIVVYNVTGSEKTPQIIIEDGAILEEEGSKNEYVIDIVAADYVNVIINGGTFKGKLRTAKKDTVKISEGTFGEGVTSGAAVAVTYTGGTLQDLMEEGYCLKTSAGEEIELTQTDTGNERPVTAGHLPLYFVTQPSIDEDMATMAEGYTKAPKLTVEAAAPDGNVSYQWYVNKTIGGVTTSDEEVTTADAKSSSHQIQTGLPVGTYEYYCVATAGGKEVTSKKVTFTVDEAVAETTINGAKEPQSSLEKALTAISKADEGIATLKILKDIDNESFSSKEIKGDVTIDLNGYAVGYKDNGSDWQTGIDKFGFCVTGGTVTLTDSSENKTGCLHGTVQVEGGEFSLESGACETLKVSTGTAGVSGGTCETVEVNSGAALTVTGDSAKITTLKALHKVDTRAEVTLSGGHFGSIAVEISGADYPGGVLYDEEYQLAIEDMLASKYAFYNSAGELREDIERTDESVTNVTVRSLNVDAGNAVVRIDVTKKDGTTASTYHASWKQAIDYLSDESPVKGEFKSWQSVKIVLLKDAKINKDVKEWGYDLPEDITVCSENETHTLTGGGYTTVLDSMLHNITLQNIKIEGAYIKIDGNLTLEEGVEVSGAPFEKITNRKATIELSNGELKLDNAKVTATTEGFYAIDLYDAKLRMIDSTAKALTYVSSVYISGKTVTAVIDANSAGSGGAKLPAFYGDTDTELKIFHTGTCARFGTALKTYEGASEVWYRITLEGDAALADDKNVGTVTSFENVTYGLYAKDNVEGKTLIYVGDNVCSYQTSQYKDDSDTQGKGGTWAMRGSSSFTMPESSVTLRPHKWETDGKCYNSSCEMVDIEKAYEGGALTIEGLEGRTYDSYPQILSKITWTSKDGNKKVLTAPQYDAKDGFGTLGFGGDNPKGSPDYTVVYKNNVKPYTLKEGDTGFNKEEAPQVTITGKNSYIGSLTIYFTIGKGEMIFGNFGVCGAGQKVPYTGKTHKAWDYNYKAILFRTDPYDKGQFSQLGEDEYIASCDRTAAVEWFGAAWENPTKVEYSTDNQKTWKTVIGYGQASDTETPYMITDAGEYPFYIRVTNKDCNTTKVSEKLTAKITPRALSEVTFNAFNDDGSLVTAYYTGKPVIPTDWDDKLVDKGLKDATGMVAAPEYTLERDTDFTITAEDNTDISTVGGVGTAGKKFAKATITGTGNYQGKLSVEFQIKSAFTLAQTAASAKWYMKNLSYWTDDGVPVVFSETNRGTSSPVLPMHMKFIVYRASNAAGLSGDVELYTSLDDAIEGRNPGYTFKKEGSHTVTLWGKDLETGYISEPVKVTLKIDTTAPTWEDENGNTEGFGIQIQENWWRKLLNTVSFGYLYNNHTLEVKIKANDEKQGVNEVSGLGQNGASYYCYIQKIDDTAAGGEVPVMTKPELDDLQEGGNDVTESFVRVSPGSGGVGTDSKPNNALRNDGNYIVYAYAYDAAGNKSGYISTEGIVVDTEEPTLTLSSESKISDTEAVIPVELSEDATLLYFYVDEGLHNLKNAGGSSYDELTAQSTGKIWEYVKLSTTDDGPLAKCENGKWKPPFATSGEMVTIAEINGAAVTTPAYKIEAKKGTTEIQITGLQPSKRFQIWMAAIDKAGNFSDYIITNSKTTKAIPKVTTLPKVSGVYGDTFANLKVADGVAKYGEEVIEGTWKVTSTGSTLLQVDDTTQCEVTFTPDAVDKYEATVVKVTPTIAPRPITIKVADMHKTYGEPLPGIDKLDLLVDGTLAAGDRSDTIRQNLVICVPENASKPDSICGKYPITFKLENKNYEVNWKYYEKLEDSNTVDHCQLVIEKAAGKINKLPEFEATQNVQYQYEGGFATFNLGAEAGHKEAALQYTIMDAKKANGDTITDAAEIANKLLSISADGKVTIKGAGSAEIMISLPESTNYTAADPLTVEVNIQQRNFSPDNIHRDFLFRRGGSDTIDLAALLPKDCGEITYGIAKTSDDENILEEVSVSPDGKLSYTVNTSGKAGDGATITVPVSTENYEINNNNGILVVISLINQMPVQPKGSISLKKDTLTYGEALSSLQFNSATFTDKVSGKTVPGKLSFDEPDTKPDAGYYNAAWTFTPTDDAYAKCKGVVTVTVKKAVPKVVSVPVPEAYYYNPAGIAADWCQSHAQKPGEVKGADGAMLDGSWSFKEAGLVPKPGTNAYPVIFTPADTENYETIEKTVTLTVKKAIPYISTLPTVPNAYTHGDHLYNQTLAGAAAYGNGMGSAGTGTGADAPVAGTFKWKAPSTKLTYLGNKTFEYIFTPEDTAFYEAVTGSVMVTVNQAQAAPFMPGSEMNVAHSCETVGSVKLPQGWKWDDADAAKALAEDDGTGSNVTSAKAVYDGADKGSYVTETVTVQITRANCEHAKKEVKGAVKATCMAEGTTGETWCLVCGKKLDGGVATPKDTSNHTNLVSKQLRPATTTQEGVMSYACSDCGYYAEKAIEKLASGGSSSAGSSSGSGSGHHSGSSGSSSGRKDSAAAQPAKPAPAPAPAPAPTPMPVPAPAQPANPIRPQGNAPAEQGEQAMPFIRGEDGKEGWDVIKAEAAARAEGEIVTVDMNGSSVVPGDVFDEIRGKDVTIEFDLGGGISWSVNGKSISDKVGDIDFRVTYGEEASDTIPVDLINALTGERTSMNVTLAYEGRFGFEAVLRINVGAANKGLVANLFYYNESTGEMEFISAGEVDEEGFAQLSFTHASDYTIVLDEASMEEAALTDTTGTAGSDGAESAETASEDSVKDNPDTESRAALIWLIAFAGIAAAAAVGVVAVKKRREEK